MRPLETPTKTWVLGLQGGLAGPWDSPATASHRQALSGRLVSMGGGTVGQVQREENMLVKFIHLNLDPPAARDEASVAPGKLTILSARQDTPFLE